MVPATAPSLVSVEKLYGQWDKYCCHEKNRGCGEFNLHMDEFRGGKITISVQWDRWKARGEENSSSSVNSSRNAKILSPRRDTHSLK
ncbi:hypothetical protein Tco_1019679 [Tanacetum coccineum]|uniref:Uncharacterized protein n=1 Tax=Tanacetum coccineum TaxID=301880 RepID=A0ABQ5FY11_9ASTR